MHVYFGRLLEQDSHGGIALMLLDLSDVQRILQGDSVLV